MFVTVQDFSIQPYLLPNLTDLGTGFTDYVDDMEESLLRDLLGSDLYDAFIAGLDAITLYDATVETVIGNQYGYGNDIWEALTEQTGTNPVEGADWTLIESGNRWLKLKNGADYTYNERVYQWKGMVALIKPYIYSNWVKDNFDNFTGIGLTIAKAENAMVISPATRIIQAWNASARIAGDAYCLKDTLYGYLYVASFDGTFDDTFDETFDTLIEYMSFSFKGIGVMNNLDI